MTTLNAENFGRMIDMMHMLKALGFSEENLADNIPLTGLDQAVTEFVNNSSRKKFTNLLKAEFKELDMIILKALLRSENNHFDILLNTLAEKIETEEQCLSIIELFDNMLREENQAEFVCVFSSEVNILIEQMESDILSERNVRAVFKVHSALRQKSDAGIGSPRLISLELLHRTRCWRRYSTHQLESLRSNENVRSWHFSEIVLDWIDQRNPTRQTIDDLRQSVNRKLDADVKILPYPAYNVIYRREIDNEFKRLLNAANDQRGSIQRIIDHSWRNQIVIVMFSLVFAFVFCNRNVTDFAIILFFIFVIYAIVTSLVAFSDPSFLRTFRNIPCQLYKWNIEVTLPKQSILNFAKSSNVPVKVKQYCLIFFWYLLLLHAVNFRRLYNVFNEGEELRSDSEVLMWYKSLFCYFDWKPMEVFSVFAQSLGGILTLLLLILTLCLQMMSHFFYTNLRLLNHHGMGKVKVENLIWKKEYQIRHWYFQTYYDGVEKSFYSVFTHTYSEITEFLNERFEQSPTDGLTSIHRSVVYYLFGWSPITLQALC